MLTANHLITNCKLFYFLMLIILFFQSSITHSQDNSEDFFGRISFPNDKEVTALAVNSDNMIFAGTYGQGILVSTNNGIAWNFRNNGLANLHITTIVFGREDEVFAGTYDGGVFRSIDNGANWYAINNGLHNLKIRAIAFSPNGSIFAGTLGSGVWRSTDDGATWKECNKGIYHKYVSALTIAIDSSVIAGTYGGGIYRSRNNGESWSHTAVGEHVRFINDFVQDPTGHIWVATNGAGVLLSVDQGGSWTQTKEEYPDMNITCLAVTDMDEVIAGTRARGIFIFDNKIEVDWVKTNIKLGGVTKIIRTPTNLLFAYLTGQGLYQSTDKGRTWYYRYLPNFSPNFIMGAGRNGLLYAWKDGAGTFRSTDFGSSWETIPLISNNVLAFEFDSSYNVYACTVEGLKRSINNGDTWTKIGYQNDSCNAVAFQPNGVIYASFYRPTNDDNKIMKSTDNGATWAKIVERKSMITALGVNKNLDVYYISDSLFRSTDNGVSWLKYMPSVKPLTSMGFLSNSTILIGAEDGLYGSQNGGNDWEKNIFNEDEMNPKVRKIFATKDDRIFVLSDLYDNYVFSVRGQPFDTLKRSFNYTPNNKITYSPEGDVYLATSVISRYFNPKTLKPPKVITPAPNKGGMALFPEITWAPAAKAELYQMEISTDRFFDYYHERITQSDTIYKIQKKLNYFTEYFIRIRSKTDGAYSDWSIPQKFITIVPAPELVSPIKDTLGIPVLARLVWHPASGSSRYLVQVATDSLFEDIVFQNNDVRDTTVVTSKLEYLKRYFWRACAINNDAQGGWSEVETFKTTLPPPQLRKPDNNAEELRPQVNFLWSKTPSGINYIIQISKNSDFNPVIFESETQTDTSHFMTLLEYDTKYFWRIMSRNMNQIGEWSEPWSFTTGIEPIVLSAPAHDTINIPTDVLFQWERSLKAEFYHFQLSKDANFSNVLFEKGDIAPNEYLHQSLDYFNTYYWRVREIRGARKGFWSETRKFRIRMENPRLHLPENNVQNAKRTLYLYWNRVEGADYYRLQLAKDAGFFNQVASFDSLTLTQQDFQDLDYNTQYFWRVKAFRFDGETDWSAIWNFSTEQQTGIAGEFDRNGTGLWLFPNPAQIQTEIKYYIPNPVEVELTVYNSDGKLILHQDGQLKSSGEHNISLSVTSLPAGKYFVRLKAGVIIRIREFVVVK